MITNNNSNNNILITTTVGTERKREQKSRFIESYKLYLVVVTSNFSSEIEGLTGNNSAKTSRFENRIAYEVVSWL